MPSISEQLKCAAKILDRTGVPEPRREATSLLTFVLQKDKTFLIAHSEYELSAAEEKHFQELVRRRAQREPLQYITGRQEFYGLDFLVTKDVLIPRPETELIVENAIEILSGNTSARFCEVGVGSGCISVSILSNVPTATAVGLDISDKTLRIAEKNAERHQISARLKLNVSDVFDRLADEKFDLIVANPPYISKEDVENLQPEVRDFEPVIALTDYKNGLTIVQKIIDHAPRFLKSDGFLLMEIGFDQSEMVREMFAPTIWQSVEILPDLQAIPRTVRAQLCAADI